MIHVRARAKFAGLLVAVTASTTVLGSGPVAAAPAGQPATTRPATTLRANTTVTLVTGDVVTLGGARGADVVAARGREHIGFRTHTDVDGDIHVVPDDAMALVSAGRLDPRLFDVTELARDGYGDADRKDLPLIVDYPGATPKGLRAARELPSVSAVALRADKSPAFWATALTEASRIWLDGVVKASLDQSVPQIGAPEAWAAGHTGAGVTVAVLDTGIDATHPDLDDAVADARDFTGSEGGTDDRVGHGTHVASIITGSGDRYKGVAPDAKLLNGKVLDDFGYGTESSIIAGMEWAAASGADVINMSLGSDMPSDGTDPMSQAVNRLTAETGALFVVAAGNTGPDTETIGSPGAADAALTVGAVDGDDQLAEFSSRGPRFGDAAIKPDITAPGVDIVAAKAANGWIGTPAGDGYVSLSGTSMATPHVAGAAAILAGQHPDWTGDQLKATLMSTARPNPDLSVFEQGAGRVDVAAATSASLTSSPGSLSIGTVQWPHQDDQPIGKTITYTNAGSEPVTLDAAATMTGPDGKPAPAGMFTVSPARVTVPAGGSAAVTLTTDTRVQAADGLYSGTVVATGGGDALRTPASVHREIESYDVKLNFLDGDGKPTPLYGFDIFDHANPEGYGAYDESGTAVMRLPKGTYYFEGAVLTESVLTDFVEPAIVVDAPAEYTFDARDGVPLGFTVDRPEARTGSATVGYTLTADWGDIRLFRFLPNFDGVRTRPSRTSAPGDFEFMMEAKLARPDGTGVGDGFHASPYLYNLRHTDDSRVPADLVQRVTDRQLAKVISSHAVATPGKVGIREHFLTMPLPFTLTEYYSPDIGWRPSFYDAFSVDEFPPSGVLNIVATPRSYHLGRTARERWNVGVFGPAFAYDPSDSVTNAARLGDEILFATSLYTDQNPGTSGSTPITNGTTQILRDGEVVAEQTSSGFIFAELPSDEATYTARTTATLPGSLSTRIDGEWTFRSAHVAGETPRPIPALAVRFAPNLDDHNAAPAGKRFHFPVYVQRNGAARPGAVRTPAVEISYDDGQSWQRVRITRNHDQWQAEVNHPRHAKFASLRWSVADAAGNTAKATIIHAYALK